MTIGEMRDLMRQKVIPEEVLPQNISDLLVDDGGGLPELDAFTFLNRLRALGISSADFAYLLEGCNAPAEAVEKIRQNPAMNLQSLILTLESSGFTSKDYTEILYTARQIWERTLTVRLDKTQQIAEGSADDKTRESPEPSFTEIFEKVSDEMNEGQDAPLTQFTDSDAEKYGTTEDYTDSAESNYVTESETFTQAFDKIAGDGDVDENTPELSGNELDEIARESGVGEIQAAPAEPYSYGSQEEVTESEPQSKDDDSYDDSADKNSGISDSFAADFDRIKELTKTPAEQHFGLTDVLSENDGGKGSSDEESESAPKGGSVISGEDDHRYGKPYDGNTTSIFKIDADLLKKDLAGISPEGDSEVETEPQADSYEKPDATEKKSPYYKDAIIAGAVGAAVLLTTGAVMTIMGGNASKSNFRYAENSNEIFGEIYKSYTAGITGGEGVSAYSDDMEVFGDLLVNKSFSGNITEGNTVYTLSPEKITVCVFSGESVSQSPDILPPDSTVFTAVERIDGGFAAAFTGGVGEECGYMVVKNGTPTYTVRQDGVLTDFEVNGSSVSVGSVYTPHFYRSFSAQDTDVFLPKLGKGEKNTVPAEKVRLSGTAGCSYGINADYSLDSGDTADAEVILGNPIYAGNKGFAFIDAGGEKTGVLALINGEEVSCTDTDYFTGAVYNGAVWADIEDGKVCIRDAEFTLLARVENLPAAPTALGFSGKNLLISGSEGYIMALDCSDPKSPTMPKLAAVNGFVNGDKALIYDTEGGINLKLMTSDSGKATETASYSKSFAAEEGGESVKIAAVLFDGDRCGAAYSYYDGISSVSEYALFGKDQTQNKVKTLFDDKTGFTAACAEGEKVYALCADGVKEITATEEEKDTSGTSESTGSDEAPGTLEAAETTEDTHTDETYGDGYYDYGSTTVYE